MSIRSFLLSGVVFSTFTLAGLGAAQAQNVPTTVLQPDSGWAVSKVAARALGGDSYCAMARKFTDNVVLTFARNQQSENSIAVDFQSPVLNSGQTYYVEIDSGHGEKRAFDVRPVSGKAMVIRLGDDPAFFDALNRSAKLMVDVSGKRYRFDIPDISKGQQDLSGCLSGLVEPAAGEPEGVPVPQAQPLQVRTTEPAVVDMQNATPELQALRDENVRLKNALERERREYEDRFMKEGEGSSVVAEYAEKIQILERENNTLKRQLSDADAKMAQPVAAPVPLASCPSVQPDKTTEAALSSLRDENSRLKMIMQEQPIEPLKAELSSLKNENEQLKQQLIAQPDATGLSAQIASLQEDNARLVRQIDEQKALTASLEQQIASKGSSATQDTATIARLQGRIDELMAENTRLATDMKEARNAASTATVKASTVSDSGVTLSQLKSIESQLRSAEEERDRLAKQLEAVHKGEEDGRINISSSNWDLEQATRRFNEAEREIRRLGGLLEKQKSTCAAEKKEIEYMLFDPEIATQEQISKLNELEQELVEAKANLARKDTEVQEKIAQYQQKISKLESEMVVARNTVAAPVVPVENEALAIEKTERHAAVSRAMPEPTYKNVPALESALNKVETAAGAPINAMPVIEKADLAPVAVQPVSIAIPDIVTPVMTAATSKFMTSSDLASLLNRSGVEITGNVQKVDSVSGQNFIAYSWETAGLFGSAEQQPLSVPAKFDSMAQQYLEKTRARCKGEFAAVPGGMENKNGIRVSAYEIACMEQGGAGASASLLFFSQDGLFTTIAHESGVETMDMAMDARDRIMAGLMPVSLASH